MNTKVRILAIAILIASMSILFASCDDSQLKKFDRAMGHVINGLNAGNDVIIPELVAAGTLLEAEAQKITPYITEVKKIAEEARRDAKTFRDFDGPARERITLAVKEISASLSRLNNEGVLHIKNGVAQRKLKLGLALANLTTLTLATELGIEEQPAGSKPE